MSEQNQQLVVLNRAPQELVVAKKVASLSRLFRIKPKTLELVSKSTRQEGAEPGTFRVVATNEKFKEMRAVILFEPVEQRELYRKGEYSRDAKECFSLDNLQPHPKAKNPPALYCETCPKGDIQWVKYREAKAAGVTGDALSALVPPCRKYWHLFLAARDSQVPYYFNVKGSSVKPFEDAMQNFAELFQKIIQAIKAENKVIAANNAKLVEGQEPTPLKPLPQSIADIIYYISFTMYTWQKNGGQFMLGMKDFKVMGPEDRAEFSKIISDIDARRAANQLQSQEESEAEAEATVSEAPAQQTTEQRVAEQNSQIQI